MWVWVVGVAFGGVGHSKESMGALIFILTSDGRLLLLLCVCNEPCTYDCK